MALVGLLQEQDLLEGEARAAAPPLPAPKAKSVIFLLMGGGPSQVDTFDPKPELDRLRGRAVPDSIARAVPRIARSRLANLFPSPHKFVRGGKSGLPVSALFPEVGKLTDELCVLRSCRHDTPIHARPSS